MHRINPIATFFLYFAAAISAVYVAACTDSGDTSPAKLAGPGDAEAIAPGIAVQCGAASSGAAGDNVCTEADLEAAIATAVKTAVEQSAAACEAKVAGVQSDIDDAKAAAVEEAIAQAGQSFVGVGESLDAGEWAGVDVRMLLGVAMCGALDGPKLQPVLLRKMEPGIVGCAESCYAQGCVNVPPGLDDEGKPNPTSALGFQWGITYSATYRQWIPRDLDNDTAAFCCCRRDFTAKPGACDGHAFD